MSRAPRFGDMILVTGASSGIGAATARELARRGFHVLAGVRRERDASALQAYGIEPVIIDITKPVDVHAVTARVDSDPQGRALYAIVNNAGIGINTPVETLALEEWRRLFETNLFGHIAVTQALLPAIVRSRGRIINISSLGGRVAMATYGPYAATKFGLEAVSDALRREVARLGVRIIVIEPGAVCTAMLDSASAVAIDQVSGMTPDQADRYGPLMRAIAAQADASIRNGVPAENVAKVIARALTVAKPRARYTVGRDAALVAFVARLVPDRMLDWIFASALKPHYR